MAKFVVTVPGRFEIRVRAMDSALAAKKVQRKLKLTDAECYGMTTKQIVAKHARR